MIRNGEYCTNPFCFRFVKDHFDLYADLPALIPPPSVHGLAARGANDLDVQAPPEDLDFEQNM